MLLTAVWILLWCNSGLAPISVGSPLFIGLVFAILYDLLYVGYWNRGWVRKP